MNIHLHNFTEIKGGLSKKKIFRKFEKNFNKIIIDFSQEKKEFERFLNVYNILKKINISIPKIYEINFKRNLIIMEDFGDITFDKIFSENEHHNLLKLAVNNLIILHNSISYEGLSKLEKYNYVYLKKDLSEFIEFYLPYKNISNFPVNEFYTTWENIYNYQRFEFNSFVHKDYEFINLMYLADNNSHLKCGIIDFQSAFIGFIGWDLFTILENSRINFSRKYNESLIKYFYENTSIKMDFNKFRNQYYLLNLSRQTRLLGRWAKLYSTSRKEYYNYINTTKNRIIACLKNIQEEKLKKIYNKVLSY